MSRQLILLLLFFFSFLSGCRKEKCDDPPVSTRRTVLVYFGTDNNFRNEAAEKIEILRNNWDRNNDGNLLVYADAGGKTVLVHIYYSKRRGAVADTIHTYPSENSANPATLTRALQTVQAYRPAASYGLIVLSHASGWLPAKMSYPIQLKSVILDTSTNEPNNYMELSDFANAIPYKLDFIIFDACFMGAVEVCYELKEKADYIVASPAELLSPGFVYSTMMHRLFAPVPDLEAVARDFYEYYNSKTNPYDPWWSRSATISVVKTAGLEGLATVVREINQPYAFFDDWENIQTFGFGEQKIYFDLKDYLMKLSPEKQNMIQTAFDQCVFYKACTPSYYTAAKPNGMQPIETFCGLTTYIPQLEYPLANEAYSGLKWTKQIEFAQIAGN